MTGTQSAAVETDAPICHLGESARWDGHRWWWLDATNGRVFSAATRPSALTDIRLEHDFGRRTTVVQPVDGGYLIVCGANVLAVDTAGTIENWAELPSLPGETFNDATVDDSGRLIIGTIAPEGRRDGRLLRIERGREARVLQDGFALSNGMGWRSSSELIHADSTHHCVWSHHIDGATVTSRRILDIPDGLPDGLIVDPDGSIWVAVYGTGEVRHYDTNGHLDHVITVPTAQVTSIARGGHRHDQMLITTAREGHTARSALTDRAAGALFLIEGLGTG